MIGRLFAIGSVAVLLVWSASAAYSGDGATPMYPSQSPSDARRSLAQWQVAEAARVKRQEDDRRYRNGQMGAAEAAAYAALLAREAEAARRERERQAYLRSIQRSRSGGGPSSGK